VAAAEGDLKRALAVVLAALGLLAAVVVGRALLAPLGRPDAAAAQPDGYTVDEQAVAARLAGSLRFQTISFEDRAKLDPQAFAGLRAYLAETWPRVHAALAPETIAGHSLLYTWKGRDAQAPALLLAAHMDVVPVPSPEQWQHPPFEGVVAGGEVWGRGALDDKGSLVCILDAAESLLAEGFAPERTIYFAFGHDEEVGGEAGAKVIAETLKARGVRLDSVLDEGGAVADGFGGLLERPLAAVGVAEKGWVDVRLRASAQGGHSSAPPRQTAVGILAAALVALEAQPMPARVGGIFEGMVGRLAPEASFSRRLALANFWLLRPILPLYSPRMPILDAMIRTTTAPTIVRGGVKSNVLPREAEAIVNFRVLPGDTVEGVLAHVRRAVGDERVAVEIDVPEAAEEASPVSPDDGPAFGGIARAVGAVYPDAVVAPYLVIGGTDAKHYTPLGDAIYRLLPFRIGDDALRLAHGVDERISVANLGRGVRFYRQWMRQPLAR
jgi:carboxypeptidase PM20D1